MIQNMRIYQVFHKQFEAVGSSDWIFPIAVGNFSDKSFLNDRTGNSISNLNSFYCELTAIYWIWKNTKSKYIGIYHYRRYLSNLADAILRNQEYATSVAASSSNIAYLTSQEQKAAIERKLEIFDIVVPRNFPHYPSVTEQYLAIQEKEPWLVFLEETKKYFPNCAPPEEFFGLTTSATLCNMFVTRWEIFDSYCCDLFTIIGRVFEKIGPKFSDDNKNRYPGYLAERFLGYWIYIKRLTSHEVPMAILI